MVSKVLALHRLGGVHIKHWMGRSCFLSRCIHILCPELLLIMIIIMSPHNHDHSSCLQGPVIVAAKHSCSIYFTLFYLFYFFLWRVSQSRRIPGRTHTAQPCLEFCCPLTVQITYRFEAANWSSEVCHSSGRGHLRLTNAIAGPMATPMGQPTKNTSGTTAAILLQ